ncbi:MAG: peptidylprolyl isomerase, partial [Pseudomonadales bacterium]|nr:peptidylprolyl isomerase [Pseudomonadales bacterium]
MVSSQAVAGTIVRVSTSIGDYSIELLDEVAPLTVQNFLGYVNRNDYNQTYLHRVVDDFVVQGGAYRFQAFEGPIDIFVGPPVPNEFSASNLRGTVAMAKIDGQPDSATNQWFVNLTDNTSLDSTNGGFTVFGNVLGAGMTILDGIDDLPTITLGSKAPSTPYITPEFNDGRDFIYMNVEVVERFSEAPHVYETNSGLMITTVSVDGDSELIGLNFNTVASDPEVILQANVNSIIPKRDSFTGIATYSTTDNRLRIPSLEVNQNGSVQLLSNVVFVLSDPVLSHFTLESYDQ